MNLTERMVRDAIKWSGTRFLKALEFRKDSIKFREISRGLLFEEFTC